MKEITEVSEIQDIAYRLLVLFHEFCEKNNLRYILAGGTMLGAVRHHDFIPWDDDVDVQMPREDYERFLKLAKDGIGENTGLISRDTMKIPYIAFSKIIDTRTVLYEDISIENREGIYIDVFPTDGLPDDDAEIEKHFRKIQRMKKVLRIRTLKIKRGKSFLGFLAKIVLVPPIRLFVSPKKIVSKIDEFAKSYSFEKCERVAFQVCGFGIREVTRKDKYLERIKVKYRDAELYVPSNYDEYLTSLYGDYMTPPPIKRQVTHHSFKAYWLDK